MCRFEYSLYILGGFEPFSRRGCARVAFHFVVQPVHRSPVTPRDQVPGDRQGEPGRVMPELLLHVFERLARFDQEAP